MGAAIKVGGGAGLLVALGMLLSGIFGVGFFGPGGGSDNGEGTESRRSESEAVAPDVESPDESPAPEKVPAVLEVEIVGAEYRVDGRSMDAAAVAALAAGRKGTDGESAPATVRIRRADDATRGARESLVEELRRHNLLYQVE